MKRQISAHYEIDSQECRQWVPVIHKFIFDTSKFAGKKLRGLHKKGLITTDEYIERHRKYNNEKKYLLSQPLSTRSDYIKVTCLCRAYAYDILNFFPIGNIDAPALVVFDLSSN